MTFLTFEGHIREIIGNASLSAEQKLAAIQAFLDASERLLPDELGADEDALVEDVVGPALAPM